MKQGDFLTGKADQVHVSLRRNWKEQTLEKTVVKVIRQSLIACRIPNWVILARVPCPKCGIFGAEAPEPGISDIAGIVPPELFKEQAAPWGRPLFIECKRPRGGRQGLEQKLFLDEKRKHGAIALFAKGWDDVARALTDAGVYIFPEALRV